jgi:hypothetical protein
VVGDQNVDNAKLACNEIIQQSCSASASASLNPFDLFVIESMVVCMIL